MPQTLTLHLLGGLSISLANKPPLRFASRRAEVLLAYIALNRQHHSRESLATLLWDDRDQKQAMANLRSLLAQLPKTIKPYLTITRQSVALAETMPVWVDAVKFLGIGDWELETSHTKSPVSSLPVSQLEEAIGLYKGGFLDGVFVRESRGLEEWTAVTRERLQQQAIIAHKHLAQHALYRRDYAAGIQHTQALLQLDPWRESSHRLLMRLLVRDGQLNAAIQQYEQCRAILADELGVEPSPETRQLQQRLLSAKLPAPFVVPLQMTPFIGREGELAQVDAHLDQPDCRLLTLVGTGGVGKTRLALQIGQRRQHDYLHGVYFVSLAGVDTAVPTLATTIATTLNCPLHDQEPISNQIINFLQEKELLLILDNIEHLLPDAARVVQQFIAATPHAQWLITSRERLHLPAEWLIPVVGLPTEEEAVALFVQRAQQANPAFLLDDGARTAVHQICRSVEGLPLGIELAAAWVRALSCAEIAAEVSQSIAILTDQANGRPQRQQSLHAVFDYSWQMLTAAEQDVLLKLAVFQGGCSREAAQQVAAATLPLLAGLGDKSLLVRDGVNGRYTLLEVLKQFIQEKWTPPLQQTIRTAHCHYYADFMAAGRLPDVWAQEMDNVRLAWQTAVTHHPDLIEQFLEGLYTIYRTSAWLQEGYEAMATAVRTITHPPQLLAKLQARQGSLAINLGRFDEALALLEEGLQAIRPLGDQAEIAFILLELSRVTLLRSDYAQAEAFAQESHLLYKSLNLPVGIAEALRLQGMITHNKGHYAQATDLFTQSLAIYRQTDDKRGLASTLNVLANNYCEYGEWHRALPLYEEGLAVYRQADDLFNIAKLLNNIGTVQFVLHHFEQAERDFSESADLCRQIGDQAGLAVALMNMGMNDSQRHNYARAERFLLDSLAIHKGINYPYMETLAWQHSGLVAYYLGHYEAAEQYSLRAIQLAMEIEAWGLAANTLDNVARLQQHQGQWTKALTLVAFVLHSHLSNEEAKIRARQIETQLLTVMADEEVERGRENGRSADLHTILALIPNLQLKSS